MFEVIKPFLGFPREDPYAHRASLFKIFPTLVTLTFTISMFLLLKPYIRVQTELDTDEMTHGLKSDDKVFIEDVGLMH